MSQELPVVRFRFAGIRFWVLIGLICAFQGGAFAQSPQRSPSPKASPKLALIQALVCEDIRDGIPYNPAVTFSIAVGKIYCYSFFDQITEDTVIYHSWLFRDRPSSRIRLALKQPRWGTFSSIQLREADKGPWRVEISDANGRILKTIRFSVTD